MVWVDVSGCGGAAAKKAHYVCMYGCHGRISGVFCWFREHDGNDEGEEDSCKVIDIYEIISIWIYYVDWIYI